MLEDLLLVLQEYHQMTKVDEHMLFVPFLVLNPDGSLVFYDHLGNRIMRFETPEECLEKLRKLTEGV
jgi:hypothetical protein